MSPFTASYSQCHRTPDIQLTAVNERSPDAAENLLLWPMRGETDMEKAERNVRQGRKHIARQLDIIQRLRSHGYPTNGAERLLTNFEKLQLLHEAHRDRLRNSN